MKDKRRGKLILKQIMRVREKKRDLERRTQKSNLLPDDENGCVDML